MTKTTIVLENLRSSQNVGSIIRSAICFGITDFVAIGTTPYPAIKNDKRLPHIIVNNSTKIAKTSLGAEKLSSFEYHNSTAMFLESCLPANLIVIENQANAQDVKLSEKLVSSEHSNTYVCFGNEVDGISQELLKSATSILKINQTTDKESLNVASAAAIVMSQIYDFSTD